MDNPRYARSRHPGRRSFHLAADLLEGSYRLLARAFPTIVVGPDLARRYARARRLLTLWVSLVHERALPSAPPAARVGRRADGAQRGPLGG